MNKTNILVTRSSMPPYEEYIEAIKPLWETHCLTNMGEYHQKLEYELKDYLGVSGISLMVNGHMALELAIQAFNFPDGSEVITTPFTFVSTTHAILRNRLKPVFCDVKLDDGTIDEHKIESLITPRTVAIVPVHVYGNVCAVEKIKQIADKYELKVIYDAAHAFGVRYDNQGVGRFGDASIFSFHATKVFNTVEGGAVTFSDTAFGEKLYNLKNFGIHGEEMVIDIGANAKMNELAAVMGLCNLRHLNSAIGKRKKIYDYYYENLSKLVGIHFFVDYTKVEKNYAYFPILVGEECRITRNELYVFLKQNGIYARKYFYPLTCDQICFGTTYADNELVNARRLAEQVLCIPIYEDLAMESAEEIVRLIGEAI